MTFQLGFSNQVPQLSGISPANKHLNVYVGRGPFIGSWSSFSLQIKSGVGELTWLYDDSPGRNNFCLLLNG